MGNGFQPLNGTKIQDVAIVGAGCAGLYCAWRLSTQEMQRKPKILVFEKERRVGGRLLSIDLIPGGLKDEATRKAELGGMRFTDGHRLLCRLIEYLKCQCFDYADTEHTPLSKRNFNFSTSLMFLRGRRLCGKQWRAESPYKLPHLSDLDENNCPISDAALNMAKFAIREALRLAITDSPSAHLTKLFAGLSKHCLELAEWRELQEQVTIAGLHLYDVGFWNLLQHCLRNEPDEFLFLHDALGYESLVANSNAAQTIPWLLSDFDVGKAGYHTLKGGMDALPRLLAYHCGLKNPQCLIADHHEVETVTFMRGDNSSHYFKIEVKCTPSLSNPTICYRGAYFAHKLILALPKDSLKDIEFIGFDADQEDEFRERLEDVTAHPAFKLFLRYDKPWWSHEVGLKARAITDLPIRQVYYLGEDQRPDGPALVMASYNDEHYVDFWDPLVNDPYRMTEGIKLKELAMSQKVDISAYVASRRIIDKAESQLRTMHPTQTFTTADVGVVNEWKSAWHFWNVHVKPWETAGYLIKPFDGINLFTCGEAYSLEQGWIEGAFKSAERVMQALGAGRPEWMEEEWGLTQRLTEDTIDDGAENEAQERYVTYISH